MSDIKPDSRLLSVELDDADHARISYLTDEGKSISEEDAERIVRFAKLDREYRHPDLLRGDADDHDEASDSKPPRAAHAVGIEDATNGSEPKTDPACGDIRRGMREADRPTEVIEQYPEKHPSEIFRHAEGRCNCDTDEPATTSPRVKPPECRDMRDAFRAGATKPDIMADFNRSNNAVNKHLFGRCDHSTSRKNPIDAQLSASECGHLRQAYRRTDTVTVSGLAAAYRVAASTAHKHLRDKCDHDVDVEPIPPVEIDEVVCADMRQDFKRDPRAVVARIARDFDTSRPTADYHIFGRCDCNNDEDPAVRR